jgi:hypothetical protein
MASFITCVELLYASEKDVEKLEAFMQAAQFSRTIQDLSTGIVYQLPANQYYSSSEDDIPVVLQRAKAAAKKTKKNYRTITIRSAGINFSGLDPITTTG